MERERLKTALWIPAWHELDQPIAVGMRQRWWFFVRPPEGLPADVPADLVFFHQVAENGPSEIRLATVLKIKHPILGRLKRIETSGLDYLFVCSDRRTLVVNAEEEPGVCRDAAIPISDWTVRVDLADVSDPLAEPA